MTNRRSFLKIFGALVSVPKLINIKQDSLTYVACPFCGNKFIIPDKLFFGIDEYEKYPFDWVCRKCDYLVKGFKAYRYGFPLDKSEIWWVTIWKLPIEENDFYKISFTFIAGEEKIVPINLLEELRMELLFK
jgi:hypothetical protein